MKYLPILILILFVGCEQNSNNVISNTNQNQPVIINFGVMQNLYYFVPDSTQVLFYAVNNSGCTVRLLPIDTAGIFILQLQTSKGWTDIKQIIEQDSSYLSLQKGQTYYDSLLIPEPGTYRIKALTSKICDSSDYPDTLFSKEFYVLNPNIR